MWNVTPAPPPPPILYTDYQWCQTCDPELLAQSWTSSGDEKLDEIIMIIKFFFVLLYINMF